MMMQVFQPVLNYNLTWQEGIAHIIFKFLLHRIAFNLVTEGDSAVLFLWAFISAASSCHQFALYTPLFSAVQHSLSYTTTQLEGGFDISFPQSPINGDCRTIYPEALYF